MQGLRKVLQNLIPTYADDGAALLVRIIRRTYEMWQEIFDADKNGNLKRNKKKTAMAQGAQTGTKTETFVKSTMTNSETKKIEVVTRRLANCCLVQ